MPGSYLPGIQRSLTEDEKALLPILTVIKDKIDNVYITKAVEENKRDTHSLRNALESLQKQVVEDQRTINELRTIISENKNELSNTINEHKSETLSVQITAKTLESQCAEDRAANIELRKTAIEDRAVIAELRTTINKLIEVNEKLSEDNAAIVNSNKTVVLDVVKLAKQIQAFPKQDLGPQMTKLEARLRQEEQSQADLTQEIQQRITTMESTLKNLEESFEQVALEIHGTSAHGASQPWNTRLIRVDPSPSPESDQDQNIQQRRFEFNASSQGHRRGRSILDMPGAPDRPSKIRKVQEPQPDQDEAQDVSSHVLGDIRGHNPAQDAPRRSGRDRRQWDGEKYFSGSRQNHVQEHEPIPVMEKPTSVAARGQQGSVVIAQVHHVQDSSPHQEAEQSSPRYLSLKKHYESFKADFQASPPVNHRVFTWKFIESSGDNEFSTWVQQLLLEKLPELVTVRKAHSGDKGRIIAIDAKLQWDDVRKAMRGAVPNFV